MHSLTVLFGPTGSIVAFLFKEKEKAEKALTAIKSETGPFVTIEDDFGTRGEFKTDSIFGRVLEDLVGAGEAVIERSLQQAKTQYKAQNRAANDPSLKFTAANGGFAINHPGAPGMPRRQG